MNQNLFSNPLEFTSSEFKQILKSVENKGIFVFDEKSILKLITDLSNNLNKATESEELFEPINAYNESLLDGFIEVSILHDNFAKSKQYLFLPNFLDESNLNFDDNLLTRKLGINYCSIDAVIEKGKKAQVGEIRNWGGQDYQKTVNGWAPKKKEGSSNSSKEDNVDKKSSEFVVGTRVKDSEHGEGVVEEFKSESTKREGYVNVRFGNQSFTRNVPVKGLTKVESKKEDFKVHTTVLMEYGAFTDRDKKKTDDAAKKLNEATGEKDKYYVQTKQMGYGPNSYNFFVIREKGSNPGYGDAYVSQKTINKLNGGESISDKRITNNGK